MASKKQTQDVFAALSWNDLNEWAGEKVVSKGKSYQNSGKVLDLAKTPEGDLIARVEGSETYITRVSRDEDGLFSECTCPYGFDCKHGVAVVLEYLEQIRGKKTIPVIQPDDGRLSYFNDEDWEEDFEREDEGLSVKTIEQIDEMLQGKTKTQLIALIHDLARRYPDVAEALIYRKLMDEGDVPELVERLRVEILEAGENPGWQSHWDDQGYTPDYSGIREKLQALLDEGYYDEVLQVGRELISSGNDLVGMSEDEGETADEVAECIPILVSALEKSSLGDADKLNWALDAVMEDEYGLCDDFYAFLKQDHSEKAWSEMADRLLKDLGKSLKRKMENAFEYDYKRTQTTDWAVSALEKSGRKEEAVSLLISEAKGTGSYERLVAFLIKEDRYPEAETWIQEGLKGRENERTGLGSGLRNHLLNIRVLQKNWPVVAAMRVESYVASPSRSAYLECKEAGEKAGVWPEVYSSLLNYLRTGVAPWRQKGWSLPKTGLGAFHQPSRRDIPMVGELIDIAILEKEPAEVLKWYDARPKAGLGFSRVDDNAVAEAIATHAPERAVAIWQRLAERLIAQVKPDAYRAAAAFLRKAASVMHKEKKNNAWETYIKTLRQTHIRKTRLVEILDALDGKPIMGKVKERQR